MTYSDLEHISTVAGKTGKYGRQVEWMEAALEVARRDKIGEKEVRRIGKLVKKLMKQHDNFIMEVSLIIIKNLGMVT